MQYEGLGVLGSAISVSIIVRIYVPYFINIMKSEIWPISHCLLQLGHETMAYVVCFSMFLRHDCLTMT